jgi:hypothetical protein
VPGRAVGEGVGVGLVPDWSCHNAGVFGGSQVTIDV